MEHGTHHASGARAQATLVRNQAERFAREVELKTLYEAVNDVILILNPERQIVFYNRNLMTLLGERPMGSLIGLRPGEALGCVHAKAHSQGCGTSVFCRECGAIAAILKNRQGQSSTMDCRIVRENGPTLDLRVKATTIRSAGGTFTVFAIQNLTALPGTINLLQNLCFVTLVP